MRRTVLSLATVVLSAGLVLGCAQKYSAEQDGKALGEALCDLKGAASAQEAKAALADVQSELDSLAANYAMFTAEDRADIDENLIDLREHVSQGNTALIQQDLTVIRRSLGNIDDDLDETSQAAWDGVKQGLDTCIAD